MRKILFVLVVTLLSHNLYAQKSGYHEITIGNALHGIIALHKYKITLDSTQKNIWSIRGDSLRMFSINIDHLEITVNNHDTIKRISLFSKETVFENPNDWFSELKFVVNVINGDVGGIYPDDTFRPTHGYYRFVWSFPDAGTVLAIYQPFVDPNAVNFKGGYVFTWTEGNKNMINKKF